MYTPYNVETKYSKYIPYTSEYIPYNVETKYSKYIPYTSEYIKIEVNCDICIYETSIRTQHTIYEAYRLYAL